jgi:hypothetical protein
MRLLRFVRASLVAPVMLLAASVVQAAPTYLQTFLGVQQTAGPTIAASPNDGFNLWSTTLLVTNNTGAALNDVKLWFTGARMDGVDAVWDNASSLFRTVNATLSAYNNDVALLYGLSDLPDVPALGINDIATVPVWNLGSMGVGQSVSVTLVRELTDTVLSLNTSIRFTRTALATVPEPASLLLVAMALIAVAASTPRCRRPR